MNESEEVGAALTLALDVVDKAAADIAKQFISFCIIFKLIYFFRELI
jgi:hypothetical protein